jgi:hypothetical protein
MPEDTSENRTSDTPLHGVALARKVLEDSLRANEARAKAEAEARKAHDERERIEIDRIRTALKELRASQELEQSELDL